MITLYESILGSTRSGKDKIVREKIEAWIDSISTEKRTSMYGCNHKNKFVINSDLSVSYNGNLYLDTCYNKDGNLQEIIEIPNFINFNTIEGNFSIKMYTINKMQKNQFPKEIKEALFIKGDNETLKDVHICAKAIIIKSNSLFSKIDNVEFEFAPEGHFNFNESNLTIDEFKKIKFVNGNLASIECSDTPMGNALLKTRNKFFKNENMGGFKEYMMEIVPKTKFPNLLKIVIKPKRKLLDTALKDWWVLTDQYGKWITK